MDAVRVASEVASSKARRRQRARRREGEMERKKCASRGKLGLAKINEL